MSRKLKTKSNATALWTMVLMVALALPAQAQDGARFALLIGNQGYTQKIGPLKNPHNDVALIETALMRLGFKVTVLRDGNYRAMDSTLKRYVTEVRRSGPGTVSFFYYSGHGIANSETQINYLIPIDLTDADDDKVWFESFQQNAVIDLLSRQAPNATHYVVFDACRNELNVAGTKAVGTAKGFVPLSDTSGLLIAYATAPRQTASDTGEGGGPYAKILAEEIVKPGVEVISMFRNVQIRVKQTIGQDPWLSFPSLPPVYLAGRVDAAASLQTAPALPQLSEPAQVWSALKDTANPAILEAFVKQFGDTVYGAMARARLEELRHQAKIAQEAANATKGKADEEARIKIEAERQRLAALQQAQPAAKGTFRIAEKILAAHHTSLNGNCRLKGMPKISVMTKPVHGRVSLEEGHFRFEKSAMGTGICIGRTAAGMGVYYIIDGEFETAPANDSFVLSVHYWASSRPHRDTNRYFVDIKNRTASKTRLNRQFD